MRIFLLLIITVFCIQTQAQTSVYHPFPDSDAVWNVDFQQYVFGGQCTLSDDDYSYTIGVDTVINSLNYRQLWVPGQLYSCGHQSFTPNGYSGSFREDTIAKKVFIIPPNDSVEYLLYDFSLQLADTVKGYLMRSCGYALTVSGIDSILINGNYRKRWNLNYGWCIIEGIGSNAGLLESLCYSPVGNSWSTLTCFAQNNLGVYPVSGVNCSVITSIKEPHNDIFEASISPNPFHESATLNILDPITLDFELIIYDMTGTSVKKQSVTNNSATITSNSLVDGIYFFQLISEKGQVASGKFVIE